MILEQMVGSGFNQSQIGYQDLSCSSTLYRITQLELTNVDAKRLSWFFNPKNNPNARMIKNTIKNSIHIVRYDKVITPYASERLNSVYIK